MPSTTHLSGLDRAAYRHTIQDGLVDVFLGAWLVAYGGLIGSGAATFCYVAPVVLIPALYKLQQRFTHPRIGFVEPLEARPVRVLQGVGLYFLLVLGVFLMAIAVTGDLSADAIYRGTPAMAGVLCAGGLHYTASRSGLVRFRIYAGVSVVSGVAISLAGLPGRLTGTRVYLVALGLLVATVGMGVFVRFLRRYPSSSEEGRSE